ncbi:hypothetical protein [Pseudomonas sp. SDO55104_S430]
MIPSVRPFTSSGAAPSLFSISETLLASALSSVRQGQNTFNFPDNDEPRQAPIVFPVYWGGINETPWDYIKDQATFNEACAEVELHLSEETLPAFEMFDILDSKILQRPLGHALAPALVQALMRSIEPAGGMTREQLQEMIKVICCLPPADWAKTFGETWDIPPIANWECVVGFIQAQLQESRLQRDKRIANNELVTDAQWQSLQKIVKDCRPCIDAWLVGQGDVLSGRAERLHDTLCMLEDFDVVRPERKETKQLLDHFLEGLEKVGGHDTFSALDLLAIDELRRDLGQMPDSSLPNGSQSNFVETQLVAFADENHWLIETLTEIERKGEYSEHVVIGGPRIPESPMGKFLWAANVLDTFGLLGIAAKVHPHLPLPPPPQTASAPMDLLHEAGILARHIDVLFSRFVATSTGWQPVAAVEIDPGSLIEKLMGASNEATSSFGAPDNPYSETVEALELAPSTVDTLKSAMGQWLATAGGYLAAAGLATLSTAFNAATRHPRTAATLTMAAIYAAVLDFYERWFPDNTDHPHFVEASNPELRGHIVNRVQATLNEISLTQPLSERMTRSNDPYHDRALLQDVERLLEQPVSASATINGADLILETIEDYEAHHPESPLADHKKTGSSRPKRSLEFAALWAMEALAVPASVITEADNKLLQDLTPLMAEHGNVLLPIPDQTLIHTPVELYRQALNDEAVLEFLNAKNLTLSTVLLHHNSVTGLVTEEGGATTRLTFDHWDNSGWWQASDKLLPAQKLLDPKDRGLNIPGEDNDIPIDAVLDFYGVDVPSSDAEAKVLAAQLKEEGWPAFSEGRKARLTDGIERVNGFNQDQKQKAWLKKTLEQLVEDKDDDEKLLLSGIPVDATLSPLTQDGDTSDLLQMVRSRGFDAPTNAGEVRNIINWLESALPPSPPLGDYGARFLSGNIGAAKLSSDDKSKLSELAKTFGDDASSIIAALGSEVLRDIPVDRLRADADVLWEQLLDSPQADAWGLKCLAEVKWYGAEEGQTPHPEHYRQLLTTAIKLTVAPDAPGQPPGVAGYDVYQPGNKARDLDAIRLDVEQHLIDKKGVSAQAAPLLAHLYLADVAPEFLVHAPDARVSMGSVSWMTLCLGVAMAETVNPGSSRGMSEEQLMGLALLNPVSDESRQLIQTLAGGILVAKGVMDGGIRQLKNSDYSFGDYEHAAKAFERQREQLAKSFMTIAKPLETRTQMAIKALLEVFPESSKSEIIGKRLWSRNVGAEWNQLATRTGFRDLLEIYMSGDLVPGKWWMLVENNFKDFDKKIPLLPDINEVFSDAVDEHFDQFRKAFIAPIKTLFAELPLQDRQCIELGTVQLYTLREETGYIKDMESEEDITGGTAQFAVLLGCEYLGKVTYFEIHPTLMKIIWRPDLPEKLPLGGKTVVEKTRISGGSSIRVDVVRGEDLPFDADAWFRGAPLKADVKSPRLIIDKMGASFPGKVLTGYADESSYVPDSYHSSKISAIVRRIVGGNFLQGQKKFFFDDANDTTSREEREAYWKKIGNFLLGLIPFVGCVEDLKSGSRKGLLRGTFGCFGDAIAVALGLVGSPGKIVSVAKSILPIRVKAFQILKIATGTLVSVINPLGGVPDMLAGGARGIRYLGRMVAMRVLITPKNFGILYPVAERIRCLFSGVAMSSISAKMRLKGNLERTAMGTTGDKEQLDNIFAGKVGPNWYPLDDKGRPYGPALDNFKPSDLVDEPDPQTDATPQPIPM